LFGCEAPAGCAAREAQRQQSLNDNLSTSSPAAFSLLASSPAAGSAPPLDTKGLAA